MKSIIRSILQTILWSVIAGVFYPLIITIISQVAFKDQANGSLVYRDGKLIGSAFMAQQFTGSNYFWPRPSACSYGTGASGISASSGSNLGPTSGALQTNVINNAAAFISGNNLPTNTVVPADMVYASASGLDPHISPEAARLQIVRVAASRGLSQDKVKELVQRFVEPPQWGFLGEPRVNVLLLNVALDQLAAQKPDKSPANG
ncbi:MAG TPA: potassium-transporting ATPase subunit KdpC [Candidatus Saccharimonadales bacterium]|jgi:K+-transporting ATPase ATPase C chain|nr:potassium-transporting ATPase subunit KdpC [Candidatus Saccharimonadales bacterium]